MQLSRVSAIILLLLVCLSSASATVKLVVSSGSNQNWIAVQFQDATPPVSTVAIKQSSASTFTQMTYEASGINAGYWTYNDWSKASFDLPLSFRITGGNGGVITMNNAVSQFPGVTQVIDSYSTFGAPSSCAAAPKIMVPLYVYPGAAWDSVISGASSVQTVAIINPHSGPDGAPNSDYVNYMNRMHNAGVEMVGYVHTSWGARSIDDVKADINTYASEWPLVTGIFLDEAATDTNNLQYYRTLYQYITNLPGYTYDIINPGVVPDAGYADVSTQIVTLEDYGSNVASDPTPTFASCDTKEKYVAIVHDVNYNNMQSTVDAILSKNYLGYVYVTDGAGGCCTYNSLSTYYNSMATYLGSK